MEEAERLCGRIGILDEGRLVAEGTRDALVASLGREARVELGFGRPGELARAGEILPGLAGVSRTSHSNDHLVVFVDDGPRRMPALWARLLEAGLEPTATELRAPDLEDVFLALTGRALRD
jgi:ABC-2 type transport system ATP-binding protein